MQTITGYFTEFVHTVFTTRFLRKVAMLSFPVP